MKDNIIAPEMGESNDSITGSQPEETTPPADLKEANNLFVQGKRSLILHDYKTAVSHLEEATRMFDQLYGVSADDCGDCYLQYGTALFELSRQESGVLDGVVNTKLNEEQAGEDDDDDDEEGDGDEEEEEDDEENNEAEAEQATKEGEGVADKVEDISESQTAQSSSSTQVEVGSSQPATVQSQSISSAGESSLAAGPSTSEPSSSQACSSAGPSTSKEEEAAEDNEPTNAEVAWEVLSLARDVFRRTMDKYPDNRIKLSDALQTMGEISLEWENFEAASELFQEALSLRKEFLAEDDRSIAESYYQIGITFSFLNEIDRANDCFRSVIGVLEKRIENLKNSGNAMKEAEIKELEELLPEMAAKIEDSREQMMTSAEVDRLVNEEESRESEAIAKVHNSPSKPINNISHLVKRKRPAIEEPSSSSSAQSSSVTPTNGKTEEQVATKKFAANGDTNGDAPTPVVSGN
jgi:tetratricopeptide (TPR) repeat protein